MKIDSLEISADLRKVLDKLQNQLRMTNSPYLKKRPRRSGDYYIINVHIIRVVKRTTLLHS